MGMTYEEQQLARELELYEAKLTYALDTPQRANWYQLMRDAELLGADGMRLYRDYKRAADNGYANGYD